MSVDDARPCAGDGSQRQLMRLRRSNRNASTVRARGSGHCRFDGAAPLLLAAQEWQRFCWQ